MQIRGRNDKFLLGDDISSDMFTTFNFRGRPEEGTKTQWKSGTNRLFNKRKRDDACETQGTTQITENIHAEKKGTGSEPKRQRRV